DGAIALGVTSSEQIWATGAVSQFILEKGIDNVTVTGISKGAAIASLVAGDLGLTGGVGWATPKASALLDPSVDPSTVDFKNYISPNDVIATKTISGGQHIGSVIELPDPDAKISTSAVEAISSLFALPLRFAGIALGMEWATIEHEHTFGLLADENNYGRAMNALSGSSAFTSANPVGAHSNVGVLTLTSSDSSAEVRAAIGEPETIYVNAERIALKPREISPIDLTPIKEEMPAFSWIEVEDSATGEIQKAAFRSSAKSSPGNDIVAVPFAQLGSIFGSNLANLAGVSDQWESLALGTILGTIGLNIGQAIDEANGQSLGVRADRSAREAFGDIGQDILDAGAAAVSSYLFAQLVNAIGVHGFAGQAVDSVGGAVIGQIATNIIDGAPSAFSGISDTALISNAAGAFVGSWLAGQLIHFDTVEGQIGASLGSAVGAVYAAASILEEGAGFLLNFALPGIGAFVGFILGGLIGSLFSG